MKAVVLREFGGPDVLRLEDVPAPRARAGRRAAARASGLGEPLVRSDGALGPGPARRDAADHPRRRSERRDRRYRRGCHDATRWRASRGYQHHPLWPMRRLPCWPPHQLQSYSSSGHTPPGRLRRIRQPAKGGVASSARGPAIPRSHCHLPGCPAAVAQLNHYAQLQPREWVLVMGAAGALGSFVVQIARMMDARVIAAAGSDERVAWAMRRGAQYGVNYRSANLTDEVMRFTDGAGVEVVCENIGDPTLWPSAFNSLARNGRLVTMGAHGGGIVSLDVRRLYGMGLRVIGGTRTRPEDVDRAMELAPRLTAGIELYPSVKRGAEAHRRVNRASLGKVLLDPTME